MKNIKFSLGKYETEISNKMKEFIEEKIARHTNRTEPTAVRGGPLSANTPPERPQNVPEP